MILRPSLAFVDGPRMWLKKDRSGANCAVLSRSSLSHAIALDQSVLTLVGHWDVLAMLLSSLDIGDAVDAVDDISLPWGLFSRLGRELQ